MLETVKAISDVGGLGALVLLLAGLGYLAIRVVPGVTSYLAGLTARDADRVAKQAATDAKIDALVASVANLNTAVARLGEISAAGLVRAGDAAAGAIGKLGDVIQHEAAETREAVYAAERRITGAVNRELVSDPPPPPSRPALTPSLGIQRTSRAPVNNQ